MIPVPGQGRFALARARSGTQQGAGMVQQGLAQIRSSLPGIPAIRNFRNNIRERRGMDPLPPVTAPGADSGAGGATGEDQTQASTFAARSVGARVASPSSLVSATPLTAAAKPKNFRTTITGVLGG